jgi:MoaA/NifB/PqqE/SkfB family radical SAM enzyme/nucleoside-diphosphate-sugar epimerase
MDPVDADGSAVVAAVGGVTRSAGAGPPATVAVLGVTGRLGPAVARALAGGWAVRGLSRRAPSPAEGVPAAVALTVGSRQDVDALVPLLDGAVAVVDLLAFDADDARALLAALARCARPPAHLVMASSIAELGGEPDGRGKRAARDLYAAGHRGTFHALVLPRLVAPVDPGLRELPYLLSARSTGRALVAGAGAARQTIAPVEGVAAAVRALVGDPARIPPGPILVGPPAPVTVHAAVRALLDGAGIDAPIARHPDPRWRGPHGDGAEVMDASRLQRAFPELVWPDPLAAHRALGAWLAAQPAPSRRPLPVVAPSQRQYRGSQSVDVHDLRARPSLDAPVPALAALAAWITPAFYLDVGRPCNAACVYCSVPPHGDTEGFTPLERFVEVVKAGRAAGCARGILIGGEPTIYPDLWRVLEMLGDAGFAPDHVVMTNGLRFADPDFVRRLVAAGVGTAHLSVDTADEATYDRLGRTRGQFPRQRAGLRNALAHPSLRVYVYTVVTRWNAPTLAAHLSDLAAQCAALDRPPPPVVLAFAKPQGDALAHADELLLAPAERAALARSLVAHGRSLGLEVGLRNLQPCLAPELAARVVDLYLEDVSVDLRTRRRVPYAHDAEYLARVEGCALCPHRDGCGGVYRGEIARGEGASFGWRGSIVA